jgi:signal transduction histidine kinase
MTVLDHITLRGRKTGTDADRLAAYRVELLTESGGFPAEVQWRSPVRLADSPLPLGGADVLRPSDGEGVFQGRRILIYNQSGQSRQPQIAELEVYPALMPRVRDWLADGRFLPPGEEVEVPAGTRTLQFSLECGQFSKLAETILYRWRVPGWKDQWEETRPHGQVTLAPLPRKGAFQLDLQARHSDGVWDQSGQPVLLRMMEPWWRNPLMISLLSAVTLVCGAAVWWRAKASVMKHRLARAEAHLDLQRERLRIARDMHDDMGARLTHIALLADRTQREAGENLAGQRPLLAELADGARTAVSALDEIVWAVNPQHDCVGDFADYLSDYAPGYLRAAGIECRLDLRVTTPQRPLGLTLRHSLLMAVKEALQNVVRHAGATVVWVRLSDAHGRLEVSVVDEGCGLKEVASGVTHSGLNHMRQRMAEAGGICEIQGGENGRGTHVKFTMPLRTAS